MGGSLADGVLIVVHVRIRAAVRVMIVFVVHLCYLKG